MNAELHLALGQDRLHVLHAEAQRAREARSARSEQESRPRLHSLLTRLHPRPRPRFT